MMTDADILSDYYPIIFDSAIEYNKTVWFVTSSFNGLFQMDWESKEAEYLGRLPIASELGISSSIVHYHGKLYIAPQNAEKIIEFDIQKKKFTSYTVPYPYGNYYGTGQYQNYIYFWNYAEFAVIRFDMDRKQFLKIEDTQTNMKIRGRTSIFHDGYWSSSLTRDFCIVRNHLYIPSSAINVVADIHMVTGTMRIWWVSGSKGYHTISYDGSGFWLSGVDNHLIYWLPDEMKSELIRISNEIRICDARLSFCDGSKIFYSMDHSSEILVLDTNNVTFQVIPDYKKKTIYWTSELYTFKTVFMQKLYDKVWFMNITDATLQTIENGNRIVHKIKLTSGTDAFIRDRMDCYASGIRAEQNRSGYRFADYIRILSCRYTDGFICKNAGVKRTIGEYIYSEVNRPYGIKD